MYVYNNLFLSSIRLTGMFFSLAFSLGYSGLIYKYFPHFPQSFLNTLMPIDSFDGSRIILAWEINIKVKYISVYKPK